MSLLRIKRGLQEVIYVSERENVYWENPRLAGGETVESTLCTASTVPQCLPAALSDTELQYCKVRGERGRERERARRRGGGGVPHCRYESKWRRQEERRIIAVAYRATALCTRRTTGEKERRGWQKSKERERQTADFSWLDFFLLTPPLFWNCTHLPEAFRRSD